MQIATAVVVALNDDAQAVDAVQPMKSGWWIYLCMNADRESESGNHCCWETYPSGQNFALMYNRQ